MSFPKCDICGTPHNPKLAHRFPPKPVPTAAVSITIDGKDALKAEPVRRKPVVADPKPEPVVEAEVKVDRKREPHVRNVDGHCQMCRALQSKIDALELLASQGKKRNASRQQKHRNKVRLEREVEAIRKAQKAALKAAKTLGATENGRSVEDTTRKPRLGVSAA